MEINQPYLFVEINDKNFNFLVVKYDENFDFKIIYSETIKSEGISNGKVVDALIISKIIKENLNLIENKINFTFKSATIISDQNTYKCINVSGYKNLSGSQITDDDISFILNDIKKIISDNQPNKTLIHLFNSKFVSIGVVIPSSSNIFIFSYNFPKKSFHFTESVFINSIPLL